MMMMDARTDQEETKQEAFLRVEGEAQDEAATPAPECPPKLPPSKVKMEPKVFQQRTLDSSRFGESMGHTDGLAEAIRRSPTHELEPIEIWWSGQRWIVVDGHHRLDAYRKVAKDRKRPLKGVQVPVRPFPGTFDDALGRSAEGNVKDKMVMREHEKSNLAWRFTCRGEHVKPRWSKARVAKLSGRSTRLVATMRKTRENLIEKIKTGEIDEVSAEGLMDLTWDQAQRLVSGTAIPWDDEKLDKTARALAFKLRGAFKDILEKNPDMCARTLLAYNEGLPVALMRSERPSRNAAKGWMVGMRCDSKRLLKPVWRASCGPRPPDESIAGIICAMEAI